jgi:hypothetical protein
MTKATTPPVYAIEFEGQLVEESGDPTNDPVMAFQSADLGVVERWGAIFLQRGGKIVEITHAEKA